MSNLLITGGAGFIGANFVQYWLGNHPEDNVVVLDSLTYAGNLASLEPVKKDKRFTFIKGDIGDQELAENIIRGNKINVIVNFAAESHVDRSIVGPDAFVLTNVVGTHNLLKAAKSVWLDDKTAIEDHRFHHVSTDEVYGSLGPDDPPFTEKTPYAPNSPYSASKAAADHLVRAYHHTYGLKTTISNCSNNYGPYQFPEKLIPLIILNILAGKPLPVYGDGMNVRDWLHVEDHCRGIDMIISKGKAGEVYNIGGNNEWANINVVKNICSLIDELVKADKEVAARFPDCPAAKGGLAESLITFVEDRLGHDRRYAINAGKIMHELGFSPGYEFESGLRETVRWYLVNDVWWRGVLDGSYKKVPTSSGNYA